MAKPRIPKITKEHQKVIDKHVGDLDINEGKKVSNFISDNIDVAEAVEKEIQGREKKRKKDGEKQKEEAREFRKGRKIIIFALVIVAIFVSSYFYFGAGGDSTGSSVEEVNKFIYFYNDFEFRQNKDSTWSTEVYNPILKTIYIVSLHYGPRDLEDIPVYGKDVRGWLKYSSLFSGKGNSSAGAGYVLFDPDVNGSIHALAYNELMRNMKRGLQLAAHPALTRNITDNVHDIPVKNCSETEEPIIWLRHKDPALIEYVDDHCIVVQGTDEDLVRAENKLLWLFYSVMEHRKTFI